MAAKQPTAAVCAAVDSRARYCCERCGREVDGGSRHHRKLRRFGDHSVANLVLLCGSGTTGCHGHVHANPKQSYLDGWLVHSWHEPAAVPIVTIFGTNHMLDLEGHSHMIKTLEAAELRAALGFVS